MCSLSFSFFLRGGVSLCSSGWPRAHYIAQAGLKLRVLLLPQPSKGWDYRPIINIFKLILNPELFAICDCTEVLSDHFAVSLPPWSYSKLVSVHVWRGIGITKRVYANTSCRPSHVSDPVSLRGAKNVHFPQKSLRSCWGWPRSYLCGPVPWALLFSIPA